MTAALRFGEREITPAEFEDAARRAAHGLERCGVGEGNVVCIMLRNEPAFLETVFGARQLGAYTCPINWHYKAEEAGWMLSDSGAKALVVDPRLRGQIEGAIPSGLAVLVTENWEQWLASQSPWSGPARTPRSSMPYTSGTTGRAKGVRRLPPPPQDAPRIDALAREGFTKVLGIEPGMRALLPAPLYHSAPNSYALQAMLNGELLVLEPKFDAEQTLALIERHALTHAYLVPTMYVRLLRLPEAAKQRYGLSSMRFVASTGSPCPAEVKRAMIDWWGPVFYESYASSETGYITVISSQESLRKPGSAGRAFGGALLKIVDSDGRERPAGEVGLIYARQPAYPDFTYNNNPEARRAIERDGLWTIGDMGYLDDEGYLYVCDRASDMVISGGVNIYPAEIEAVLAAMPGVRDCAVFGIPDAEFGEALAAAIQPEPGATLDAEAVRRFLGGRIAGYKVPRVIAFHADLPREESGKIFKRRLRAPYWEKSGRRI